jgi:hypothetical protein
MILGKLLNNKIGEEVVMTVRFKLIGKPSEKNITVKKVIKDNFSVDPSMRFSVIVAVPNIK